MSTRIQAPFSGTRNVLVAKFPPTWTERELRQLGESYGAIESARVMLDLASGRSRCYGFLLFFDADTAIKAVADMNGLLIGGAALAAELARVAAEDVVTSSNLVVVRNIAPNVLDETVHDHYAQFGTIVNCRVRMQRLSRTPAAPLTKLAFIEFANADQAAAAVRATHNEPYLGGDPLIVKLATSEAKVRPSPPTYPSESAYTLAQMNPIQATPCARAAMYHPVTSPHWLQQSVLFVVVPAALPLVHAASVATFPS